MLDQKCVAEKKQCPLFGVSHQTTGFLIAGELIWQLVHPHTHNTYTEITHTNTLGPLTSAPGGVL